MRRKTTDERCKYYTHIYFFAIALRKSIERISVSRLVSTSCSRSHLIHSHSLFSIFGRMKKSTIPPQKPLSIITKFLSVRVCARLLLLRQHIFSIQCLNWFDCDIQTIVLDSHQSKFRMISLSSSIIIRVSARQNADADNNLLQYT